MSGTINLVFSYQGGPSDVIMANGSIDQTKNFVFEINMKAVGKSQAKALKAWDVSNGNDTMISLLNLGENDQDLYITFFFYGGRYRLPVHLRAGGSTMLNVSDIIAMQQPDSDGNKIPPGTLHGSAVLSSAAGYPEWINVGVSVGVFNVWTATCGNTCPTCFGYSDFRVQADTGTAPVGQDTQFSSWAFSQNNIWQNVTLQSFWSSSNIQVAKPSGSTVGAFTGVSGGSFNAQASANLIDVNADCAGNGSPCPFTYYQSSASGFIQVPTYFMPTQAGPTLNTFCAANQAYYAYVDYQLGDQLQNPIRVSGLTPQESVSVNGGQYSAFASFATPVNTTSSGTFEDVPIGTCFSAPPPPNRCVPVTQKFQILVPGFTNPFPITTVNTYTECEEGIKITINPIPPGATYSFGITQ